MESKVVEVNANEEALFFHIGKDVVPKSPSVSNWMTIKMREGYTMKIKCGHCDQTFEFKPQKIVTKDALVGNGAKYGKRI